MDLTKSGVHSQINDDLIYKSMSKKVVRLLLQQDGTCGLHSEITEDALLDFCFRSTVQCEERELRVGFQHISNLFFAKLVKVSAEGSCQQARKRKLLGESKWEPLNGT